MDEELFRLVTTGLLALVVLLLLLALARLGKLQRGSHSTEKSTEPPPEEEPVAATEAVALPVAASEPEPEPAQAEGPDSEEEGPFERDGRWWFRRDGELLVYDERTEEWVDPNTEPESAGDRAPLQNNAIDAESTAPETTTGADEPQPHPLEEARGWDTAPADATQAPIPEPVSPPEPITQVEQTVADVPAETSEASGGHWKCPACGVINGSTATSCRMCFAARP